jgi:hypothetical protein
MGASGGGRAVRVECAHVGGMGTCVVQAESGRVRTCTCRVCVSLCVCVCVWTLATCVRVCCEWLLSVRAAVRVPVRPPALARIPIEAASASQCRGVHRRGPQAGAERLRGVQVSVTVDSVAAGASGLEASVTAEGEAGRTN